MITAPAITNQHASSSPYLSHPIQRSKDTRDAALLQRALDIIDEANSADPQKVEGQPYRLLYSKWLTKWVKKLDPAASDELLLLARGKNIEGWQLSTIKRDDYAPNVGGNRLLAVGSCPVSGVQDVPCYA